MTITNLKQDGESTIIIEGHVDFVTTELMSAASCAGRASGTAFEDAMKDELVHQFTLDKTIPPSHNVFACVMVPTIGTRLHSWNFAMIAISRFA